MQIRKFDSDADTLRNAVWCFPLLSVTYIMPIAGVTKTHLGLCLLQLLPFSLFD
jgi:hypothetical protein